MTEQKTGGRRYFDVASSIWAEPWDQDTRYLAFYILTCRHRITEGLFKLPMAYVLDDLGWEAERLAPAWKTLLDHGFMRYDQTAKVVLICKALRYQKPENPNQRKAALRKIREEVPQTHLLRDLYLLAQRYCEGFAQDLLQQFGERIGESPFSVLPAPGSNPPERESGASSVSGETSSEAGRQAGAASEPPSDEQPEEAPASPSPYWERIKDACPVESILHDVLGKTERDESIFTLVNRQRRLHGAEAVKTAASELAARESSSQPCKSEDHRRRYFLERCQAYAAAHPPGNGKAGPPEPLGSRGDSSTPAERREQMERAKRGEFP